MVSGWSRKTVQDRWWLGYYWMERERGDRRSSHIDRWQGRLNTPMEELDM
jgi:hypothetical protein